LAPPRVAATDSETALSTGISEDEVKRLLVGKALFLRGCYLSDTLGFDEHGRVAGQPPQGSYTLNAIQIDRVQLTKHKVELEGIRYGLHFSAQLATEDPSKAFDRVRITPKKKVVKITIDREIVVKPKKEKKPPASKETNQKATLSGPAAPGTPAATPDAAPPPPTSEAPDSSEANQLRAYVAIGPDAERPADYETVTTTSSPAHAAHVLRDALDQIFAQGLDDRMMAAMPDFWKLYFQAVADKVEYRPKDPSILRQNTVDQKARILTKFAPESNEFAQENGVAGMAQYHVVIGPDGKAGEIAISRPIGFGLDENAVAAIRAVSFQPAVEDGKPVPVMLDLDVPFRIFSKRTDVHSPPGSADKPAEPIYPGPYSVPRN
jgi:hypothetical protein